MDDIFSITRTYSALSIQDLLSARDQYHYQLMNKENVIATAIGYYRIRKVEHWPSKTNQNPDNSKFKDDARTLANSEVRPDSWPAVLVFVNNWKTEAELKRGSDPRNIVPKTLFLPDGKSVPVCVIYAPKENYTDAEISPDQLEFPRNVIGGGFPLSVDVQDQTHYASLGCLVTDGHYTYALTNKHVVGEKGTEIYSVLGGVSRRIGESSGIQLGRVPFNQLYPGWGGENIFVNVDIGLIKVDDVNEWKTDVYQIGTMGRLTDLHTGNFNLNLIGAPVMGYGCYSKKIEGVIQALFYRYKSMGGYEYVSDFLIGPGRAGKFSVHAGDSGTVMMYQHIDPKTKKEELMPIGVLWGQHILYENGGKKTQPYALVNCLSLALNKLDVDLVRDWNLDQPYVWGKVGHYTVALKALNAVNKTKYPKLWKILNTNAELICFKESDITKNLETYKGYQTFCPLADVADIIFKFGGTGFAKRGREKPNHYADIDLPRYSDGKSLRDLVTENTTNLDPAIWSSYYDDVETPTMNKGILPFRVWQIFKEMIGYISSGDELRFLTAAGILTHYVGDGCQPLHSSFMSQGEVLDSKGDYTMFSKNVHTAYEDKMVDAHYADILKGIDTNLSAYNKSIGAIKTGKDAGMAVFNLMCKTQDDLKPIDILNTFQKNRKVEDLWTEHGDATIQVMSRGACYMARIWEAAWELGNGETNMKKTALLDKTAVKNLYEKHPNDFIPSFTIDQIKTVL
jgi:hypothetical protein